MSTQPYYAVYGVKTGRLSGRNINMTYYDDEEATPVYPGSNVTAIKKLISIAMEEICETYWNSRHTFLFSVEQSKLAKKFLLKKAVEQVTQYYEHVNGLALLEAMNDLREEIENE